MVHTKEAVLMPDIPSEIGDLKVFGSTIFRSQIVRVEFCMQMPIEACLEELWDVSLQKNGSILAWAKGLDSPEQRSELYIAANTKIKVQNCRGLFWGYENVREIRFNNCLDTSSVSDMSYLSSSTNT